MSNHHVQFEHFPSLLGLASQEGPVDLQICHLMEPKQPPSVRVNLNRPGVSGDSGVPRLRRSASGWIP